MEDLAAGQLKGRVRWEGPGVGSQVGGARWGGRWREPSGGPSKGQVGGGRGRWASGVVLYLPGLQLLLLQWM